MRKTINLIELSKIIYNKSTALEFLCKQFQKKNTIHCTSCDSENYYIISRGKLRCKDCKIDYRPFSGTWFDIINIDFTKWLALVKLFDLGISARCAAKVDVSYPTALNAFDCIRYAILYHLAESDKKLKGKIEADEAYFGGKRKGNRGRGARNKTIVFGILERDGKVHIEIVNNVKAKTLLKSTIRKVKKGSIVYTDQVERL